MVRIGLLSDSHGELDLMREAARKLIDEHRVDLIVHLGDNYEDAEELFDRGPEVIRVPGVYSSYYQKREIQNRIIRQVEGVRLLLTHSPRVHENDLPDDPDPLALAEAGNVDIVAYGHTHRPLLELEDRVMWLNPGHLRRKDKKGARASYALLDVSAERVSARILDLATGGEVASKRLERSAEEG